MKKVVLKSRDLGAVSAAGDFIAAALALALVLLLLSGAYGTMDPLYSHNLTVRIISNNALSNVTADANTGYVAAKQGTSLIGIVRRSGTAGYISFGPGALSMNMKFPLNKFYIVFTEGSAMDTMPERIAMVKSGEFDKYARPSFGFALSDVYHVVVSRKYTDIDIEGNETLRLMPGMYNLVFKSDTPDGRSRVFVSRG